MFQYLRGDLSADSAYCWNVSVFISSRPIVLLLK